MMEETEEKVNPRGSATMQHEQGRIKDHELLFGVSSFLLGRTGRSTMECPDINSVLAEEVQAYGKKGRGNVLAYLEAKSASFPASVLSVNARSRATVLVEYHDGSGETIRCGRDSEQRVVVELGSRSIHLKTSQKSSRKSNLKEIHALTTGFLISW